MKELFIKILRFLMFVLVVALGQIDITSMKIRWLLCGYP